MGREWTEEQRQAAGQRLKKGREAKGSEPAILPTWRRLPREQLRVTARSVTMCDPRCRPCQSQDNVSLSWYRDCPHDPYVTMTPVPEPPVWEDILDDQGNPTGRKKRIDSDVIVAFIPTPNTREISLSVGANSGRGVEWARRKGFILPSEVRSPHFPNGIAEACQYRDCKWQQGLTQYGTWGTFCREEEAQYVWYFETGTTLEVGEWSDDARLNKEKMLGAAQVR